MPTRLVLLEAGPTPWDIEGRVVGSRPLPLAPEAIDQIRHLLEKMGGDFDSVYTPAENETCAQAAQIVAKRFTIRVRDNAGLEEPNLGLWEGLTPHEIRARFPTVYPQWEEAPSTVTPPEGEPLEEAVQRIGDSLKKILKRNKSTTIAMVLRPMALQIALGLTRREPLEAIAGHLHAHTQTATIDLEPEELNALLP